MTGKPLTPKQAEMIRQYFSRKIDSLKRSKIFYRDRLFKGSDPFDLETYDKILDKHPESTIPLLMYQDFQEVYELLALLTDSIIESEQNIVKLNENIKVIGNKTHADISGILSNVADLETNILPCLKRLNNFANAVDKNNEQRKKNGENMIV